MFNNIRLDEKKNYGVMKYNYILIFWVLYRITVLVFTDFLYVSKLHLLAYQYNQQVIMLNYIIMFIIISLGCRKFILKDKWITTLYLAMIIPTLLAIIYIVFERPMSISNYAHWFNNNYTNGDILDSYTNEHLQIVYYGGMSEMEAVTNYCIMLFVTLILVLYGILKKIKLRTDFIILMIVTLSFPYQAGVILLELNVYFVVLLWYIYNDKLLIKR